MKWVKKRHPLIDYRLSPRSSGFDPSEPGGQTSRTPVIHSQVGRAPAAACGGGGRGHAARYAREARGGGARRIPGRGAQSVISGTKDRYKGCWAYIRGGTLQSSCTSPTVPGLSPGLAGGQV
eukprot:714945-Prorocentrum_minimum.AAC.3